MERTHDADKLVAPPSDAEVSRTQDTCIKVTAINADEALRRKDKPVRRPMRVWMTVPIGGLTLADAKYHQKTVRMNADAAELMRSPDFELTFERRACRLARMPIKKLGFEISSPQTPVVWARMRDLGELCPKDAALMIAVDPLFETEGLCFVLSEPMRNRHGVPGIFAIRKEKKTVELVWCSAHSREYWTPENEVVFVLP